MSNDLTEDERMNQVREIAKLILQEFDEFEASPPVPMTTEDFKDHTYRQVRQWSRKLYNHAFYDGDPEA